MKRSLIFILTLMLLATVSGEVFAQKKNKVKDKRYEPVARALAKDYEGKYVGVEDAYFLEIQVAPDGEMSITSYEGVRKAVLKDIRLAGPIITATKIYTDGVMESFSGVFANRILNGDSAFGIIVDNVQMKLEGGVTLNGLFYRLRENGSSSISYSAETDINIARREIEARYALLAEAVRNKDFAAFQSLRTENFSTWPPDGEMMDSEQMAARARALLERIQAPISLTNEIETLILMDHEAIAIVHQKFSRMQEIEGRMRLVETSVTQRETWVKTTEGWKLKFVDNVHDQQTLIDGQRVEKQ